MATIKTVFSVDLDRDVRTLQVMVNNLKDYLLGTELYGVMPGSLPRLTVGGLLMRLNRLTALENQLATEKREALAAARREFEQVRAEWGVAYNGKITHELKARFRALGQFLAECEENPRGCADAYPSAMEKRVMIEALQDEATARSIWTSDMRGTLDTLDNRIHRVADKHPFCWNAKVEGVYPPDKYWFLYLLPQRSNGG